MISQLNSNQQRVLALAAVVQAAALVHQVASTGKADEDASRCSLASLFVTSPQSTEDVYGEADAVNNLRLGLLTLKSILNQDQSVGAREITRYVLGLTHLQNKLRKRPAMLNNISKQLSHSQRQVDLYELTHPNVFASVAETYSSTLSSFHFRIQVTGNPTYLQQPMNTNRVRSYLLAGIRATTLWRQVGGRKWQLVLFKNSLQRELNALLDQLKSA
ncbi:MAG: high frequency lysogenization protein HflD [Gammaproteobacteria bacterium]|nr:high frequency lysogenization protein HflD [Gammaproteobacteria bacterium]